jgi:hypothetical protein
VQNNSVGFCALFGLLAIRMLRFLIDPVGTPNAVAASAMALFIISSVSAGGTRSRPCSLLIPPASAPRARPHCRWPAMILGHYDVPGQLRDVAHVLPVPLGDYDLGNCNFRCANEFIEKGLCLRKRAPKRSIRSASNIAAFEFRSAGEIWNRRADAATATYRMHCRSAVTPAPQ